MTKSPIKYLLFTGLSFALFSGCMEEPLQADLSNANLKLDTLHLYDIAGVTYQVPPTIGNKSRLTLGISEGYEYKAILLKTSFISTQSILWTLFSLLDTSIYIDSAFFTLVLPIDSLENPASFSLLSFPTGTDSVFSESNSNYLNFTDAEILQGQFVASALEDEYEILVDTVTSTAFRMQFNVMSMLDSTFLDSSLNYTVMLTMDETDGELHSFYSREFFSSNNTIPTLDIYFRQFTYPDSTNTDTTQEVIIDTLKRSFRVVNDLSIMVPPEISEEDTSFISLSRGKGLRSLIKLDFLDSLILPKQTTFDKVQLTLHVVPDTNITSFSVFAAPLEDTVEINQFTNFDEDDFEIYNYLITSGIVSNNTVVLNIKNFLQDHYFDHVNNLGLKLYASVNNNLHSTLHFYSESHDSLYPKLFIQYVAP